MSVYELRSSAGRPVQRCETDFQDPEHLTVLLQLLMTNASKYSKGLLSEILEFVMGNGMIPGTATHCF